MRTAPPEHRLASILLGAAHPNAQHAQWEAAQDRARELSAVHGCRVRVQLHTDDWGLTWADLTRSPEPTGA